jgi:hypothetical protein
MTPLNEPYFYAAYIITAAIYVGYAMSLFVRRRALRERASDR